MIIRDAKAEDMGQVAAIYAYYVENTAISFECEVPTEKEMERRRISFRSTRISGRNKSGHGPHSGRAARCGTARRREIIHWKSF